MQIDGMILITCSGIVVYLTVLELGCMLEYDQL
jgi:hypothetical protein